MKRRFLQILTLLILFLPVSCRRDQGMYILHGTVQDGTDTILVMGLDSRFEDVDTIFCNNGQFKWTFRPDTVTTLILVLPDGRRHPVFAEKDVESSIVIPADTGLFQVSGGYCNDSYQSFYLASLRDSSMDQTAARIDSFITRDPFSEVAPYLIYDQMVQRYHADQTALNKLIGRMSGNMQDAPFLTSLKAEFKPSLSYNVYISNLTIRDSADVKSDMANIANGAGNHLLVCVWASWMGQKALDARKAMEPILKKYEKRRLSVIDISVDVNKERWKEAISKDTLSWTSYIDIDGLQSRLISAPSVEELPVYLIFTGTKRIHTRTTSLSVVDKELDEALPLYNPQNKEKTNPRVQANRRH